MRVINLCTTENKVVIMTSAKRGENWNQITVDNFILIFGLEKSGGSGGLKSFLSDPSSDDWEETQQNHLSW